MDGNGYPSEELLVVALSDAMSDRIEVERNELARVDSGGARDAADGYDSEGMMWMTSDGVRMCSKGCEVILIVAALSPSLSAACEMKLRSRSMVATANRQQRIRSQSSLARTLYDFVSSSLPPDA